jgi:D-inositol-3-phosphate glycosyltransferase
MLSVHTCPLAALGGKETGGMNVYVRELSRQLASMGVPVDVFTRSQDPRIPRVVELADGARVVHVPAGPEAPMPRERVHAHLDEFVHRVDAWRLAAGADYRLVHAHYWLSGVAALALRERWRTPVVQMFHTLGHLKNGAARADDDREPDLRLREESRVARTVDRIVAASHVERRELGRLYGATANRVHVIPCGVDTALFTPGNTAAARATLGLDARPTLLYVGRIAPIKGLVTLLDAVARLRDLGRSVRLLVVGGDTDEPIAPHEAYVRGRTCALGLCNAVTFLGAQPQAVLRDYYVAADVVVMPSYYESFGMVALEAMACGRPVIASRVGGLASTVRDGITGFLVPDGNADMLAQRLDRALADPALRARLGAAGVEWAAEHGWPRVARAICREYGSVAHPAAVPVC